MSDQGFAGWTGEAPDGQPPMPLTETLLRHRERGPGDVLEQAAARSRAADARQAREAAEAARDPDEIAAGMIARGYQPGLVSELVQRCQDAEAELAAENEKIAEGERVTARVRGMLERGQIGGAEAHRMLDGDFGDVHEAEKLERKLARYRARLTEAQAMISPAAQRAPDPVEAAASRAHAEFVAATRARWAEAQGSPRARPPFTSGSRGGLAVRSEPVTCPECIAVGANPEQSYLIHADPDAPAGVALPDVDADLAAVPYRRDGWEAERAMRAADAAPGEMVRAVEGAIVSVR